MKYVIAGSLGHISKPLSTTLVHQGHLVVIITSKSKNVAAIEALGATAAVGSVEDKDFIAETFAGADGVYTMVPPKWDAPDWKKWIGSIGENYASAINSTGVRYVVNLSSVGAHLPEGAGSVSGLYRVEQALNSLPDVNVVHLRPAYFYDNLLFMMGMIKSTGMMGGNFGDEPTPLVHTRDIAVIAADELLNLDFEGHTVRYIAGDERTGQEIAEVLGKAIGKPELPWVVFSDEQNLAGTLEAGVPPEVAKNYTEMGRAMRTGSFHEDYLLHKPTLSPTKLEDFAPEFVAAYNAS